MTAPRPVVLWTALAAVLAAAVAEGGETTLHLTVPVEVAARAARRSAGDATTSPPILILEGVEVGDDEGLTISVLGPAEPGSSGPVLAVTGLVGRPQTSPRAPLRKMTLAVPLNDRAAKLLVGRSDVVLTLRVTNSPGRPALKIDRAFFQDP